MGVRVCVCVCVWLDGFEMRLTVTRIRWTKHQIVPQDVEVIPHVQLVVSRVVFHSGDVLVLVGEVDVDVFTSVQFGVVHVVDEALTDFALIVFICGSDHIENPTDHKSVGGRPLIVGGLPSVLEAKGVGVELTDHHHAVVLLGGIEHPKAVFVSCQVDVCFTAPLVR